MQGCGEQVTAFESQFSPSIIWILGIKLGHQAWHQSTLPTKLPCPILFLETGSFSGLKLTK